MTPAGLTKRQLDCLTFIKGFIATNGYSPSLDDIAAGIGLKTKSQAHYLVYRLRQRGRLTYRDGLARSIALVEEAA